jgi:hypothetical protein
MRLYQTKRLDDGTLVAVGEVAGELCWDTGAFTNHGLDEQEDAVTQEILEAMPGGRKALLAWRAGDDSAFEAHEMGRCNRAWTSRS